MQLERITESRWYDDACGTALALELVGERWTLLIVRELMFGPRRFGEIKGGLPGISANVLTQRLAGMERAGIVVRRQLPSPANVQVYDLTAWGRESETAIHVVSGHPEFVFLDGEEEVRLRTSPGDYIFVPPYVPHREENPDPSEEAVVVIARSTQEAIVVNLPKLYALPAEES